MTAKDGQAHTLPADLPPLPPRRDGRNREAVLQRRIVMELRREGYAALAVNGEVGLGGRLGMLLQMIRKALGYEPGTPEVIVALPRGRTLWLEIKAPTDGQGVLTRIKAPRRGGRLSKEQERIHGLLRWLGHRVETVRSEVEALEAAGG